MTEAYEEILEGETYWRRAPDARHELICERLHMSLWPSLTRVQGLRLLPPRAPVSPSPGNVFRPDLTLISTLTQQPWLIAEVIDSHDHHFDTVRKKAVFERVRLPRLWMVDPRYNNLEVYQAGPYGLSLIQSLAASDVLTDPSLPGLALRLAELFAEGAPPGEPLA
jgi:Uma2 family endonuclease